jgi:hypothetical protein
MTQTVKVTPLNPNVIVPKESSITNNNNDNDTSITYFKVKQFISVV